MKNLQFFHKRSISKLVLFFLIVNSFMFTDAFYNQSYAAPAINEMNINTTDNEVSVYGTGDGNGAAIAEKPFRYTIGSSQSDWVRDASNMSVTETLAAGTLSNTSVVNNALQLSNAGGILNGYTYKSIITIDHSKIDASLTNFPLTVCLNSSNFDFTKAKADGTDIRFTDTSLNPLKFEREEHSAANAKAVYNVQVPTVSSTADTQVIMWYGNANAYNASVEAWQDQTGKRLKYNGNVKLVTGVQAGKRVANFGGTNDGFVVNSSDDFNFGFGNFTLEGWFYFTNNSKGYQALFDRRGAVDQTGFAFYLETDNTLSFVSSSGNGWDNTILCNTVVPLTHQWMHLAVVRNGNTMTMYKDGVAIRSSTFAGSIGNQTTDITIGVGHANPVSTAQGFQGCMRGIKVTKGKAIYTSNFTPPDVLTIDSSDVVFCTDFDTIYDQNYQLVQHMDTLTDASGGGENLANSGASLASSDYGSCMDFNGTNSYLRRATTTFNRTAGQELTASAFVKPNWSSGYGEIIANRSTSPNGNWMLYQHITAGTAQLHGASQYPSTYTPPNGQWVNLEAKVTSGNVATLFADGALRQTITGYAYSQQSPSELSIGNYGTAEYWNGSIGEVRISNIARSDAWIKAESLSLKNSLVTYSAPTVISQYVFSGTRESVIYDVSGSISSSRIQWSESKPTGTNIIVESNVSIDGGSSWLGWKACTNGDAIPDLTSANSSNARLKLRQTLSSSSGTATPSLSNSVITVNFSKYVHRISATPNKEYTVKFEIKDVNGIVTSNTRKVYTKAQAPLFAISGATDHSVDLLFSDTNPSTTEYQIMCDNDYVNSSGVLTSVPTWITLKNKSVTILGLNIGTMYNFNVKARNTAEEETNYASPINITTQGVPVPTGSAILAATALNNSVTLGWDEIPNSLSYELELDGIIKNVGLNTSYIHKDLMTNTQHIYRIRGRNQEGFSDWSNLVTITTTNNLPLIPTNVVAKASNNSVSLYWSSVQDALTYTVEIDDTEITDVSKNSACLFGLEPETTHTYRVKACNLAGESEWSETGTITTNYLNTPEITQTESDSNTNTIVWNKIEGATTYQIALDANENFRTLYASDLEEFATGASITFTHDNLPIKTAHVYRVRAICPDGASAWCDSVTLETLPQRPAIPTNFRGNASNNFINLIWDAIQDAIGYDLEVDGVVIENDNTPQYQYKGLDQYTEHTYRVRSVNNEIESYWSNMLKIRTLGGIPDEPKNVVITNSRGIATLDWDKTPGALNYDVEICNNTLYTISKDTFVYRCVPLSTSSTAIYQETAYRLRAGNDLGKSGWSDYYVNNAIMAKVEKGKEIDLGLTASNIMDFSKYTLYVNYNDKALTVTDLCAYSVDKELGPGIVEGHYIEIVSFSPGHIVFRVNKIIDEGYLWTGIINNIKFVGNATGGSTITYTAQCSKE